MSYCMMQSSEIERGKKDDVVKTLSTSRSQQIVLLCTMVQRYDYAYHYRLIFVTLQHFVFKGDGERERERKSLCLWLCTLKARCYWNVHQSLSAKDAGVWCLQRMHIVQVTWKQFQFRFFFFFSCALFSTRSIVIQNKLFCTSVRLSSLKSIIIKWQMENYYKLVEENWTRTIEAVKL